MGICAFCCLCVRCPPELGLSSESPSRVQEVEEGAEPVEFGNAIGQQDRKAYDCMLQGTHLSAPVHT